MSEFHTSYYKFQSPNEEDIPANEDDYLMHVPDRNKAQWHHIEDLDSFFVRVYQYHQNHGFVCMLLKQCFELIQFVFVVVFAAFLLVCIDYDILFANKLPPRYVNNTLPEKITWSDVVYPGGKCTRRIGQNGVLVLILIIASAFWLLRAIKVFINFFRLREIKSFYRAALHVKESELDNLTWHEVQQRLMLVQEEQQMCIHKQQLTELDIYNRILRFKNYLIAMTNKGLLPPRLKLPFLGDTVFLTRSLKFNIELIFFWGPRAIFANNFHMKDEYKNKSRREELATRLSSNIMWLGLLNLALSPAIFLWQILYSFFSYAEVLKREPGVFGARMWSMHARLYLRHFNELPHEFQARLNRGYKPASHYMDTFTSPIMAILSKNVAFFVGSLLAVLFALTIWDEDVLKVEHVLTAITLFSLIINFCSKFIPDEHAVSCPEHLMQQVLAQVHYAPDSWRGEAHTNYVRDQFAQIFQYKAAHVIEELLSPIITPFILIFWMRHRSLRIVDFFRNFTVDIAGVGDVCSFAQLDINKHGDPKWHSTSADEPLYSQQADDGKTELSLMHFAVTNPKWHAPQNENKFLTSIKAHAQRDASQMTRAQRFPNPLLASLQSLGSVDMMPSNFFPPHDESVIFSGSAVQETAEHPIDLNLSNMAAPQQHHAARYHGARASEGPIDGAAQGLVSSIVSQQGSLHQHGNSPFGEPSRFPAYHPGALVPNDQAPEMASLQMSISALYVRELHHQRLNARHNQMWETIADDPDASAYSANANHSAVMTRAPVQFTGSIHKRYDAISGTTHQTPFGRSEAATPHDRNFTTSTSQVAAQPFLSMMVDHQNPDRNQEPSSDSDAPPQEFNLLDNGFEGGNTSVVVTNPYKSTSLYRPPEM